MSKTINMVLFAATFLAIAVSGVQGQTQDGLKSGFIDPPQEAHPRVWWHWVSGNVTEAGTTADFEWMKRTGVAGMQMFDGDLGMPALVSHVERGTPEWKQALGHAATEADRLGLEMAVSSSAGWSILGAPWVTPAQAMKKYVWSETSVKGGKPLHVQLAAPPETTGPMQGLWGDKKPNNYATGEIPKAPTWYRDTVVVAYRKPVEEALLRPEVTSDLVGLDATTLTDGDLNTSAKLVPANGAKECEIDLRFPRPVSLETVTLWLGTRWAGESVRSHLPDGAWEASDDGNHWRTLVALPGAEEAWLVRLPARTYAFPRTTAKYFRLRLNAKALRSGEQELAEIAVGNAPLVNNWEDKAGFGGLVETYDVPTPATVAGEAIDPKSVVDLTAKVKADGTLDWDAPSGEWTVLRFGYSLTGKQNAPASMASTGLETDKLSAEHVRAYLDTYTALLKSSAGPEWGHALRYLLMDSWECGNENWTERMLEEFRQRRGYDLVPWMPVLTGRVEGNAELSEAVLWDFRRTLADMLAENFYGVTTSYLHAQGLGLYSEAPGVGLSTVGDGLLSKSKVDIPMGEFWVPQPGKQDSPKHLLDVREAASAAHIYGKQWVGAESFTTGAELPAWDQSPLYLKLLVDQQFSIGLNRVIVHTSTHQPFADDEHKPGLMLGKYGTPFNRNLTWANEAKDWVSYLARCSWMLSRGKPVADVAYFSGENAMEYMPYWKPVKPSLPEHYDADTVNADVLLGAHVERGRLVLASGTSYGVLVLPADLTSLSPKLAGKLEELVQAGMVLLAPKPVVSPTMEGGVEATAKLKVIADRLWGTGRETSRAVGKGRVYASGSIEDVLAATGTTPDVMYGAPKVTGAGIPNALPGSPTGRDMAWAHRKLAGTEIYFVSTPLASPTHWEMSFRGTGHDVALWDPATGASRDVNFTMKDGRTFVGVDLDPVGSVFVVLRDKGTTKREEPELHTVRTLPMNGPWELAFPAGWGAAGSLTLPELMSWTKAQDSGVRYFSGTAMYRKTVDVPQGWTQKDGRVVLDLGLVREIAEVRVNGKAVGGALWKPPFRVDVTDALRTGTNEVEVRVTNLWRNRLIGDMQPGVSKTYTFTTFKPYKAGDDLDDSGLLGPVKLEAEAK